MILCCFLPVPLVRQSPAAAAIRAEKDAARSVSRSMARLAVVALAVLLLAPALGGCGKKGAPTPPPGVPDTYPRPYPRE
jgi:predicted small lipoprotein YifL